MAVGINQKRSEEIMVKLDSLHDTTENILGISQVIESMLLPYLPHGQA